MTEKEISDTAAVLVVSVLAGFVFSWIVMFLAIAIHLVRGGCP